MNLPIWSHTFLDNYRNCPLKAYRKYVAKDLPKEPETQALKWGNAVHDVMERRLTPIPTTEVPGPLPPEMQAYEPFARILEPMPHLRAEKKYGITAQGHWTGFFAADVWGRGKVDVSTWNDARTTAFIVDWKTGKRREDPSELLVNAVLIKANLPDLKTITGAYIWLGDNQMGTVHDLSDTAATLNGIRTTMAEVEERLAKKDWPATPNPLCGWCPVKDCKHNRS